MIDFLGRLHPLLVHLPIGILLLAFVLECLARWFQQEQVRPAIRWALGIGLASAALSAGSGWLLAADGGYDDIILERHRWLGLGTLGVFSLLWFAPVGRWYLPLFSAGVLLLIGTGHFGGTLTHGDDFLFGQKNKLNENMAPVAAITDETPIFKAIIQPILKEKCVSCHRPEKRKGDLVLTNEQDILAGGKHGKVLIPGNADSSRILFNIHLPLHDDHHMPPAGKPQLSSLEVKLLEWWITSGADFQALVKDKPLPPDLKEALDKSAAEPVSPVFALTVPSASVAVLKRLGDLNIKVQSLGAGKPWLAVSLAGQQTLKPASWDALNAVSDQLVDLDLSHTPVQEQDLPGKNFPHLVRLNLAHNKVGNGVISLLEHSPFLESLNLTNTLVDNALQSVLPKLPYLKKLFLWQTKTTPEAVADWRKQYPKLQIETGDDIADSTLLTLRSPKMLYGRSFFEDTMQVELSFPFKGIKIYYTLDEAASPTTQSPTYQDKIVLDKTSHLRAFAAKDGWGNSPLVEAMFVRKKFPIATATLLKPPSPKYPAKGGASLIDGKISDERGADTWLGYEGEHLDAILDLGETRDIGHVYVHCLENNGPWIFKPAAIQVSTSLDGKKYQAQAAEKYPQNAAMGEQKAHLLACHFPKVTGARYVKVHVESLLKNPSWHPGKGKKCWIFVDEMTVE